MDRSARLQTLGRGLGCLTILAGLPMLFWATNMAGFATSNLCHSAASTPAIQGAIYPGSRADFLLGGEAAPVGPGYTVMDFSGQLWFPPPPVSNRYPRPEARDTVLMTSPTSAEYRFQNGSTAQYDLASRIVCLNTGLSGLGLGIETLFFLGVAVLILSLVLWFMVPRWPLPVTSLLLGVCALVGYLFWNVYIDVPVARGGMLAATGAFAGVLVLTAVVDENARRRGRGAGASALGQR